MHMRLSSWYSRLPVNIVWLVKESISVNTHIIVLVPALRRRSCYKYNLFIKMSQVQNYF